ncbi:MAG TPA: DUF1549 and DUF1553 domain-containing protein [Planctomycetaceae bacterium]|nr:DUF1549 and DUF1553 domain-containing protein [Planctomycetaceae bacterium]
MISGCLIVTLALAGAEPRVDFDTQVVPVLTKAGCNAGACHGAAAGRGGFRLSLWGSDPEADFRAIVRELEGRRVNFSRPADSLIVVKPSNRIGHGGGLRLAEGSAGERLLFDWIAAGATRVRQRTFARLEVEPATATLAAAGDAVPLKATALFDDGSHEDVTAWTVFTVADSAAVELSASGYEGGSVSARVLRPGQHVVVARFLSAVIPVQLLVPYATPEITATQPRARADGGLNVGFIDAAVNAKLVQLGLPASPPADDAMFLRRARLDLTGRLPTPDEIRRFLTDDTQDKRDRLIDRLMATDEFTDFWTFRFATLLRIRGQGGKDGRIATQAYHRWLREQVSAGTGFDRIAKSLLTATGDTHEVGPANFWLSAGDAREQAELVSEVLLGVRLRCANCHNHPLDRWTQDDYHGLAAVFARVERGRTIQVGGRGEITHPKTGAPALPRIPAERFLDEHETGGDPRDAFADWLTAGDNPYFARAIVNRLWRWMLGRGLIEPVDDLSQTNPATHPELLDQLAGDFVEHGYDFRRTLRLLASSETYARSARSVPGNEADATEWPGSPSREPRGNEADDRFYSHALVRPLEAEILLDAICDATGIPETFQNESYGRRTIELISPAVASTSSSSLDILGRCDRTGSCDSAPAVGGGLRAKLHAINGSLLNRRIASPQGWLHEALAAGTSDADLLEACHLRTVSRPPTEDGRRYWNEHLAKAGSPSDRRQLWEDILWSLLSCREFQTNH